MKNEGRSNSGPDVKCMRKEVPGQDIADWMIHPEEAGPQKEAVWCHHWTNRERVFPGKTYERA